MKKLIVTLFALSTFAATTSQGGPVEPAYQPAQTYQPAPDWFRDREWNFDLFGAYAWPARPYEADKYLGTDHAWGGGINANYMFSRYFGVGVEGYGLAAHDAIFQASGNLVARYPIPGTHLAPYGYAGGGVIFNGTRAKRFIDNDRSLHVVRQRSDVEAIGQVGAGLEFRFTPNIGVINDFSWNIINGDRNNFGMVRSGIRFAF